MSEQERPLSVIEQRVLDYRQSGLAERLVGCGLVIDGKPGLHLRILKVLDISEKTYPDSIIYGPTLLCYGESYRGVFVQPRHYWASEVDYPAHNASRRTHACLEIGELRGASPFSELASKALKDMIIPTEQEDIIDFVINYAPTATGQPIG